MAINDPIYIDGLNANPSPQQSIDPVTPPEDSLISIDTQSYNNSPVLTPEVAERRAGKFKYGLDEILNKSQEQIFQNINDGEENDIRVQAAGAVDEKKLLETQKVIQQVTENKGKPLTFEEADGLVQIIAHMSKKTDPASVLEEAYGKQFMATLDRTAEQNPDNVLTEAKRINPEVIATAMQEKSTLVTKREFAQSLVENIEGEIANQGWVPFLADAAKGFVPGYNDVKLRGNADVGIFAGIGLGQNLEEQRKSLLRLPFEDYKIKLNEIATKLRADNPQIAAEFVKSVVGMSSDDVFLQTGGSAVDLATSGYGKAGIKAAGGVRGIARRLGTSQADKTLSDALKATDDMSKAAANPDISRSGIHAAAGDLKESAVVKATGNIAGDLVPDSPVATKHALEALPSTLRTDLTDIAANPGRHGQEIVNRISESATKVDSMLTDAIEYGQKIDRLPEVMATENGVRVLIEYIKDAYPSLRNAILDVTRPYREAVSNTYLADMHLGKGDGTYFSSRTVAENFIKYHGIKGDILEGTDTARKASQDVFYVPRKAIEKNEDFGYAFKDGKVHFYKDAANQVTIDHSITPKEGYVPVTVDDRGRLNVGKTSYQEKLDQIAIQVDGEIFTGKSPREALDKYNQAYGRKNDPKKFQEGYVTSDGRFVTSPELPDMARQRTSVEQQGLGYYIKVTKPLNETDKVIRDLIAETKNTQIPDSKLNQFINGFREGGGGKIRTPQDVLSRAEMNNRITAVEAPKLYFELMKENAKEIRSLFNSRFLPAGRKRWEDFMRVVEAAQDIPDPLLPKNKGYFFKDPAEFENYYQTNMGYLPDQGTIAAYFEFKRGMEVDRIFRNIAEHRNQQRLGAETHAIIGNGVDGKPIKSAEFSGVEHKQFPSGSTDNIVVMGDKMGEEKLYDVSKMNTKQKKDFDDGIKSGAYRLIEMFNPELRELNGFGDIIGDARVRYVLTKTAESRELDWNHIPRRGGGHLQYDYDHYIKQANVRYDNVGNKYWYEGDTTLMPIQIRAMGSKVAGHLDEVRKLLKGENEEAARLYSNKNLHIDWDTVKGWFSEGKDETGKFRAARLNLDERIQVVSKNKSIMQVDKELERKYGVNSTNFKNGTKEGSLARLNQVEFSGERDSWDVFTLEDKGSRGKPLYQIAPAKTVDPITTMNRGLQRIAHSNFMDDYKTMSVEHWLKQASKYLDASDSEIWGSPYFHYNQPKWKGDVPEEIKGSLLASKYHTDQLVGTPSATEASLHSGVQKLQDMLYNKVSPKATVPSWLLPTLKDPLAFGRSIAFDFKLGLFNLPQFIVQANNYANIYGIAGHRYATPGAYAAQLHFWSRVNSNENIMKWMDEMASKLDVPGASKWKPGEFLEAKRELDLTGFGKTGGEYAALDNPNSTKVVGNAIDTFLDWGRTPFKLGEENAKYGAWYTAFKEFRDKNPVGAISQADRSEILRRADLLNVNMSRASSSAIHQGIWSVPTQFYTYQIRLLEMFLGNRITGEERMRMFKVNALLYGVPMAGGLTGLPVADWLNQKALENGYVVGDNYFHDMLMQGVPSAIGAIVTGEGDPKKGINFDFGNRFGTKGLEMLGGMGEAKPMLDMLGGPLWSIIKGTVEQSDGFTRAMISMMKGDGDVFPMTTEDIVDVFKEISTVNTAWRTLAAINTGRWISKKEAYLTDTSGASAVFSAITGLKDQRINDLTTMSNSIKQQGEYEKAVEKQFLQEYRRGVLAQKDNNTEQAQKFFTRAQAWLAVGGYREDRVSSLLQKAISENQSVLEKVSFDFYVKKAPQSKIDARREGMKKLENIKERQEN